MMHAQSRPKWRHTALYLKPEQIRHGLDRNTRARIMAQAEALDRRTRTRGRHGGVLGRTGLEVLRCLLMRFSATGACFPSIATIAKNCAMCTATVVSALARLERAGLVRRVQRLERRRVTRECHLTGEMQTFVTSVQSSNAYLFSSPIGGVEMLAPGPTGRVAFAPRRQGWLAGLLKPGHPMSSDDENNPPQFINRVVPTFSTSDRG